MKEGKQLTGRDGSEWGMEDVLTKELYSKAHESWAFGNNMCSVLDVAMVTEIAFGCIVNAVDNMVMSIKVIVTSHELDKFAPL